MPNFELTDRIAIVTGGSQGIGQAISLALAEHGAHIVIASRTADKVGGGLSGGARARPHRLGHPRRPDRPGAGDRDGGAGQGRVRPH